MGSTRGRRPERDRGRAIVADIVATMVDIAPMGAIRQDTSIEKSTTTTIITTTTKMVLRARTMDMGTIISMGMGTNTTGKQMVQMVTRIKTGGQRQHHENRYRAYEL